jgi:hypothetical protein
MEIFRALHQEMKSEEEIPADQWGHVLMIPRPATGPVSLY